jgi:hypothetical protein
LRLPFRICHQLGARRRRFRAVPIQENPVTAFPHYRAHRSDSFPLRIAVRNFGASIDIIFEDRIGLGSNRRTFDQPPQIVRVVPVVNEPFSADFETSVDPVLAVVWDRIIERAFADCERGGT